MKMETIIKEIENGNFSILDFITPDQRKQVLLFIKEKTLKESFEKEQKIKEETSRKI